MRWVKKHKNVFTLMKVALINGEKAKSVFSEIAPPPLLLLALATPLSLMMTLILRIHYVQ